VFRWSETEEFLPWLVLLLGFPWWGTRQVHIVGNCFDRNSDANAFDFVRALKNGHGNEEGHHGDHSLANLTGGRADEAAARGDGLCIRELNTLDHRG